MADSFPQSKWSDRKTETKTDTERPRKQLMSSITQPQKQHAIAPLIFCWSHRPPPGMWLGTPQGVKTRRGGRPGDWWPQPQGQPPGPKLHPNLSGGQELGANFTFWKYKGIHTAVNSPGPGHLVFVPQRTVFPQVTSRDRPVWKDPWKQLQGSHWCLFSLFGVLPLRTYLGVTSPICSLFSPSPSTFHFILLHI